jgi:predicted transcriptional regulator
MKSVFISIQPKWCELIASGKKTVEVRKTKPKLETPFKVYIYCTSSNIHECLMQNESGVKLIVSCNYKTAIPCGGHIANGKVIGEFVCDRIDKIGKRGIHYNFDYCYLSLNNFGNDDIEIEIRDIQKSCIPKEKLNSYGAHSSHLFAWHISDLVIYDNPKELSEFIVPSNVGCCNEGTCSGCRWFDRGNGFNIEDDCNAPFCTDEYKPLRKAPQSWCYVEEVQNG